MSPDDGHYTFNELNNEDKALLLANGYKPGELAPEEEQELLRDLRDENEGEDGPEPIDEADGTDA